MKKTCKILALVLLTPILLIAFLDVWSNHLREPTGKGSWTSVSPDGRFSVIGYSAKSLFTTLIPTMPGDGSFGPGIVVLRENKTGKVLQKERVENVSDIYVKWMVGEPHAGWRESWVRVAGVEGWWQGDYVDIRLVETWPLPDKNGKLPPPMP